MKRIYLVRHGFFQTGVEKIGIRQSKEAAEFLVNADVNAENAALFSSEIPRAITTAEILRNRLQITRVQKIRILNDDAVKNVFVNVIEFARKSLQENVVMVTHEVIISHVAMQYAYAQERKIFNELIKNGAIVKLEGKSTELVFTPSI